MCCKSCTTIMIIFAMIYYFSEHGKVILLSDSSLLPIISNKKEYYATGQHLTQFTYHKYSNSLSLFVIACRILNTSANTVVCQMYLSSLAMLTKINCPSQIIGFMNFITAMYTRLVQCCFT
mgnify:CR=1 FL=1